jgi:hypothetical protein
LDSLSCSFKALFLFGISPLASGLAHVKGHSVARIALPRAGANTLFHCPFHLVWKFEEEINPNLPCLDLSRPALLLVVSDVLCVQLLSCVMLVMLVILVML